ncbi:aldose 1-epimerase [Rhodoferax saidenbachensis]|uniref:Aldose epimerase n=1 Tax=Rhodoferax saidenbachensis TaxID=1484693 RepID=A0A1P8K5F4_9BURK|nr:aldose 1-epimerase [Rhodoferax saidenbachensis]APW41250.1 aldose epimerase [Rhodoferax saidenbachensis]
MSANNPHPIHWLQHAGQRLGLVPSLGGGVAAWQLERAQGALDLWRPWDGRNPDRYSLASFAMVPWSNRISQGGFTQGDVFHRMRVNRIGEPYPIHGDGWLQAWKLEQPAANTLEMTLHSQQFEGNPYAYRALQRFVLRKGGMDQTLSVTHTGAQPLPYGLGQHPWFLRTPATRLHAPVQGVWLSGVDPLPVAHTTAFPPSWDPCDGLNVNGTLVDNAYTGWSGAARITWPEHQLQLEMRVPEIEARKQNDGFCLLYRPAQGPAFCFEPITHPIDAFHVDGQPGLRVLQTGETLTLHTEWRFSNLP